MKFLAPLFLLLSSFSSFANSNTSSPFWELEQNKVEVQILENNHPMIKQFQLPDRVATINVENEYSIKIINKNKHRVFAIFEVDRVNPLDGKKSFVNQSGRIIPAESELIISKAKFSKNQFNSLLPSPQNSEGYLLVGIFHENPAYPLILPGMQIPPFGPENYIVSENGTRTWIPPVNYPFRKIKEDSFSKFQFFYKL